MLYEVITGEDLDGHVPPDARVTGAIDLTHSPRAEGADDLVGTEPNSGFKVV